MKTVLIIDDDAKFRDLLAEVLRLGSWQVLQAQNGEEGIAVAKQEGPALVLCDLLMARGNGFQVCRALRELQTMRRMKIVVISGSDFETDRQAAFQAGADEYLTKPIQPAELLSLLSRIAREQKGPFAADSGAVSPTAPPAGGLRLKFWGVRGSIPTPGPGTLLYGGNTSCVEVRGGGEIIILDAGTGLRALGRELSAEFGNEPLALTLLLTHTHWDHIQGLPFFQPVYKPQNHVRILGYEGARHGLDTVLSNQMESPFFPIGLGEVPANLQVEDLKSLEFKLGGVRVQAFFAYHPGVCVGYRLSSAGRSLAFFPDNELRREKSGSPGAPTNPASLEYAREENRKLTEFLRETDVLVMDAQYDREEYKEHVGWGHGCVDDVVELALRAGVKQLFLFHHDPDHDDARITRMVEDARQLVSQSHGALEVHAAREGQVIEMPVAAAVASAR